MCDVAILPFETVGDFYQEYVCHCSNRPPNTIASERTFGRAFSSMRLQVRLLRCKGSFPTCEVCNTANDLLRNAGIRVFCNVLSFYQPTYTGVHRSRIQRYAEKNYPAIQTLAPESASQRESASGQREENVRRNGWQPAKTGPHLYR
jgi:hypothetical protein